MLVRSVLEEKEVDEQHVPFAGVTGVFDLSDLSEDRQLQVRSICSQEVFQEKPGRTDLVVHDIVFKGGASVRQLSYRILKRLLSALKEEAPRVS